MRWVFILLATFFGARGVNADAYRWNEAKAKSLQEIVEPTLAEFVEAPSIYLPEMLFEEKDYPKELKDLPESKDATEIFDLRSQGEFNKAYIAADKFLEKNSKSAAAESIQLLKADLLFQAQAQRDEKRYNLALEEYQDFIRQNPLHSQNSRVLYQIALTQLLLGFSTDVEATISRALKDYPNSQYVPFYHLLLGEQAFKSRDDIKANFEFSFVIQKFPDHSAAVDSAYRKAYIIFRKGQYADAIKVYEDLAKYHLGAFDKLRMNDGAQDLEKFTDRVIYAESLYQTKNYKESARLLQDLGNIFPENKAAPFILARLADTYLKRGKYPAAEMLYRDIQERYSGNKRAKDYLKLKLADLYFVANPAMSARKAELLYSEVYGDANQRDDGLLASLALVKLAHFHFFNKTYLKAKVVLDRCRSEFKDSANKVWIENYTSRILELEILDHYNREDYMAALATYLVAEQSQTDKFRDTPVLLKLADASVRLGLMDKASQILNRVVYLDKTATGRQEALLRLIDIAIQKNELKKASERLRRFSFAYPKTKFDYVYNRLWGDLYGRLNNHDKAIQHYEKSLKVAGSDQNKIFELRYVYMRLADLYQKVSLPIKAIQSYEKFIALYRDRSKSPLSVESLTKKDEFLAKASKYRIADLYFEMRDYVKAIDSYKVVIQDFKNSSFITHAQFRLGESYLALNDRQAAIKSFQQIADAQLKNLWADAAKSYVDSVTLEVKHGIRIFN